MFNDGWRFIKRPLGSDYAGLTGLSPEPVEIPHDWLIGDARNLYESGEGWYCKSFERPAGEVISLRFEGVYMDCTIYINGASAFEWKYGYTTFEFDCTPFLRPGINEAVVQVRHEAPNSRWYSGAGIYRNVWLRVSEKDRFLPDGIYITPVKKAEGIWELQADCEILTRETGAEIRHTLLAPDGTAAGGMRGGTEQSMMVENPRVWDVVDALGGPSPALYTLRSGLYVNGTLTDEEETRFGFREAAFHPEKGFILNGRPVKLRGVCLHHDLGCLGAAVNRTAIRRQLALMQEMGANAIRTAHNMPAVELMELADEMGLLVCSEAYDMWERSKTSFDNARFFNEWAPRDVAAWVRRDRNHPSLILWSIGNEIYDTHAGERGQELTRWLQSLVHRDDPKSHAAVTIGSNYMPWENARKCADIVKVAGYNYAERYYEEHHRRHPDWVLYGSETCSTVQSRGIYHFPLSQPILVDDDEQCSSLGNSTTSWGAKNTEACICSDRDASFSAGQFIWTGIDYIGEPTPYFTKNSYFGQADTAGFPKDAFYVWQSVWTDYRSRPMVHIFPYWDFSEGQEIDVRVCSNAPRVELFFNGVSQGTFDIDHRHGTKLVGDWQIPYQNGELLALAYDENGNTVAQDVRRSFGDGARLRLEPDKTALQADGRDLIFLTVSVLDGQDRPVENACNRVHVSVSGAGRLVGLDNGDSTDRDSYKGTGRRLFSGKLLAVVASTYETGDIHVTVTSPGLETAELTLAAQAGFPPEGVSDTLARNHPSTEAEEIPIRKLELVCSGETALGPENRTVTVKARILPQNSTYRDIRWRVTTRAGIDSYIAALKTGGDSAELTALGDGEVWLRCMADNGDDKPHIISQLRFTAEGLGEAFLNPYQFISAGLYTHSDAELTNGNERGIATPREGSCYVGFGNVDFGDFGSDTLTLPIFAMEPEPFELDIWEGIPGEVGSQKLCTVPYTKGSVWDTYLPETYVLPRRLRGVKTLCFGVHGRKIQIKGFVFQKPQKAYAQLGAKDYTALYGDSFTVTEKAVEKIGNNVTLRFEGMDFGEGGFSGLRICGRTPLEGNTIHIRIAREGEETVQLVEFPHVEEYTVKEFPLKGSGGACQVEFVFLPGSQFDFQWFQFIE